MSAYPFHPAVAALLPPHPAAEYQGLLLLPHLAAVCQGLLHHQVIHHQAELLLLLVHHLDHHPLLLLLPAEALLKQLTDTPEAPHPEVTL